MRGRTTDAGREARQRRIEGDGSEQAMHGKTGGVQKARAGSRDRRKTGPSAKGKRG